MTGSEIRGIKCR